MLRWTCRLRDAFEERGFLSSDADSSVLSQIKEAEFVVDPDLAFPREFRWETFCSCFKYAQFGRLFSRTYEYTLADPSADAVDRRGLVPAMNTRSRTSRSIRAMNGETINDLGQRNIDVLWLSPTVFISAVKFQTTNQMIHDYEVTFEGISCFITQLPAFDQVAFETPSPLPISFFQHLAPSPLLKTYSQRSAPRTHNACLTLTRNHFHPKRLPAVFMGPLMAVFPSGKLIFLGGPFKSDELRVVFSFPFHPLDTLDFSEDPFDDSVSLDVLMELLKTAPFLRRIELPWHMFYDESEEREDVCLDIKVDSPALSMSYQFGGPPTHNVLNAISRINQGGDLTHLHLDADRLLEGGHPGLVTSIVHPFLDGSLQLENLWIHLSDGDGIPAPNVREGIVQELANTISSCRSTSLCMFTVSLGEGEDGIIHKIRQWDETIFPQLVLNQVDKKMNKSLDGRLLELAVAAINRGVLYRKTTDHIPYDMSTANAGLIFHHIKTDAVKAGQN
jgi:hypothetical protein